jgi:YesN/AraC family two-component response regulator
MHKILIIDDELPVRFSLRMILKGFPDLEIDEAHNGREGLEKIQQKKYDLAFLDIKMPDMQGDQVIEALQTYPEKPKIVLVSAYTHTQVGKKIAPHVQGVIAKPFSVEEIRSILNKLLMTTHLRG